jgi:hypothetical protein
MKQKELLLWVVAIGALVLSLITVIGPKGLSSNAARSNLALTQSETLYQERQTNTCTYRNDHGGISLGTVERDPFSGKDLCVSADGRTYKIIDIIQAW